MRNAPWTWLALLLTLVGLPAPGGLVSPAPSPGESLEDPSTPPFADAFTMAQAALNHQRSRLGPLAPEYARHGLAQEDMNLETARDLDAIDSAPRDASDLAFQVAAAAAAWQRESIRPLDSIPPAVHVPSPGPALYGLASENPGPLLDELLLQLDTLPGPLAIALAQLLDAFSRYAESVPSPDVGPGGEFLDARQDLLAAALEFQRARAAVDLSVLRGIPPIQVAPVVSISLDETDDVYDQDYALLIDAGGNDRYLNNAGGNNLNRGICFHVASRQAAALLDFGGNDAYVGGRDCGANGGAEGQGAGFLYDAQGNDRYEAGSHGTNGGATGQGFGFLLDAAGEDSYVATAWGVNGGGRAGHGLLVDLGGDDAYLAGRLINEIDHTGERGANGGAMGGTGFLVDWGGEDAYAAGTKGVNGGAETAGAGFLYDRSGDDNYTAGWLGTNAGAAHNGVGFLYDRHGDDTYVARLPAYDCAGEPITPTSTCGGNGAGHLGGTGFLLDAAGDDAYISGDFGANGGAFDAVGFLVDWSGDDYYVAGDRGANGRVEGGSLGLLWDGAGLDRYEDREPAGLNGSGTDCTVVPKGDVGAQVDYPRTATGCSSEG